MTSNPVVESTSVFIFLFRGLFASNYTETHYLEDGTVVTGSHNFTVCFHFTIFLISFDTVTLFKSPAQQLLLLLAFSFLKLLYCAGVRQRKSRFCTRPIFPYSSKLSCAAKTFPYVSGHILLFLFDEIKGREEVRKQSECQGTAQVFYNRVGGRLSRKPDVMATEIPSSCVRDELFDCVYIGYEQQVI